MQFNNNNNQMPNIPIAAPPQQPTQSGFESNQPQQNYAPPVLTCSLCKCQSFENNRCLNCGKILGIIPARFVKGGNTTLMIRMTVTDRYLVFKEDDSTGEMFANAAAGMIGSLIYDSVRRKKAGYRIGMIDLRTIRAVEFFIPSSKMNIGAIHIYFHNGKDYAFGINEIGMKKINLPVAVNAFKYANVNMTIQNVYKTPRIKPNDPFYKKGKDVFVTVSQSATSFIAPFKGMIVAD